MGPEVLFRVASGSRIDKTARIKNHFRAKKLNFFRSRN